LAFEQFPGAIYLLDLNFHPSQSAGISLIADYTHVQVNKIDIFGNQEFSN
jgi:hypothetical protein